MQWRHPTSTAELEALLLRKTGSTIATLADSGARLFVTIFLVAENWIRTGCSVEGECVSDHKNEMLPPAPSLLPLLCRRVHYFSAIAVSPILPVAQRLVHFRLSVVSFLRDVLSPSGH